MMNCNVIKDLLPLAARGECSAESMALVEEHMRECPDCAAAYEKLKPAGKKAAAFRGLVLAISAVVAVVGLVLEACSKQGLLNGYWFILLAAAGGALCVSAASWFLKSKDRKWFSDRALLIAAAVMLCAYILAALRYDLMGEVWFRIPAVAFLPVIIDLEALAAAKFLAKRYAKLSGIR